LTLIEEYRKLGGGVAVGEMRTVSACWFAQGSCSLPQHVQAFC